MNREETKEAMAKVVVILLTTLLIGFALGLVAAQMFNHEEEAFYRGVYTACVAQTRDEVGCLNMQQIEQRQTDKWEWDLWQWPLPPKPTPTPRPHPTEQRQSG